jgi:hypothetical protein
VTEPLAPRYLEEWPEYARLNRANELLKEDWYGLAIGPPFLFVVVISLRYFSNSSSGLIDILVGVSLVWAC